MDFNNNYHGPILVTEDSDEDYDVLQFTFRQHGIENELLRCVDGSEVLPLLRARLDRGLAIPGLILLDLNLIGVDGREALRLLKQHPTFRCIPVLVITTSSNEKDIRFCYEHGVASYAVKPVSFSRFEGLVLAVREYWLRFAWLPTEFTRIRERDA